jgi:hypothetical protein
MCFEGYFRYSCGHESNEPYDVVPCPQARYQQFKSSECDQLQTEIVDEPEICPTCRERFAAESGDDDVVQRLMDETKLEPSADAGNDDVVERITEETRKEVEDANLNIQQQYEQAIAESMEEAPLSPFDDTEIEKAIEESCESFQLYGKFSLDDFRFDEDMDQWAKRPNDEDQCS